MAEQLPSRWSTTSISPFLDPDDESIRFSVDGIDFEIDLNGKHARQFRKEIGRYIAHAKKVDRRKR